jgi:hypothetical protein
MVGMSSVACVLALIIFNPSLLFVPGGRHGMPGMVLVTGMHSVILRLAVFCHGVRFMPVRDGHGMPVVPGMVHLTCFG